MAPIHCGSPPPVSSLGNHVLKLLLDWDTNVSSSHQCPDSHSELIGTALLWYPPLFLCMCSIEDDIQIDLCVITTVTMPHGQNTVCLVPVSRVESVYVVEKHHHWHFWASLWTLWLLFTLWLLEDKDGFLTLFAHSVTEEKQHWYVQLIYLILPELTITYNCPHMHQTLGINAIHFEISGWMFPMQHLNNIGESWWKKRTLGYLIKMKYLPLNIKHKIMN